MFIARYLVQPRKVEYIGKENERRTAATNVSFQHLKTLVGSCKIYWRKYMYHLEMEHIKRHKLHIHESRAPHMYAYAIYRWEMRKEETTYVIIFKNGSSMCKKCCSGQHWKNLTNFCTASFFSKACSTFLLSLSWAKHTATESNAVTDQNSSSRRLRYTSSPPCARNCSLELRDAWAISQSKGNAYCLNGESDIINCIKWGIIPFSAACSCLLLLILHRLNSAFRTFKKKSSS